MEMAHLGLCGSVPKYLRLELTSESDSESELFFKIFADARRWILELILDTGRLMALAVTFLDVLSATGDRKSPTHFHSDFGRKC